MSHPDQISDFIFESVLFDSPRLEEPVQMRDAVTDIEITEDLKFCFLTGRLVIVDNQNFISEVDFLGGETVTITISSTRLDTTPFTKKFYLTSLNTSMRNGYNGEVHVFDMVEDIMYESNLQNLNLAYNGKTSEIITKIAFNFLGKEIESTDNDIVPAKVIIPNLNPIEAMTWLKDRAYTSDGYPFYLHSSLTTNKIYFTDLGTMLSHEALATDIPYRYSPASISSDNPDVQRRILLGFEQSNTENLYDYIQKGLVGSEYSYIHTLDNKINTFSFDVFKDMFSPLIDNILPKTQNNVLYSDYYNLNGKSFNQLKNRKISYIGGSSVYKTGNIDNLSYRERNTIAEFKNDVISRAMKEFLIKAPITIMAHGLDFIDGDAHTTIGNNIRIQFLNSNPDTTTADYAQIDTKKSGDYLISAARHSFTRLGQSHKHKIKLSCVKMANYTVND